jgi:glycosyltransferase domain-containing protein
MKSLTLIIPTHNRQNYLIRSYSYYSSLNIKVIYCDSSISPYNLITSDNISYIHLPNYTFSQKILYVLEKLDTDYVALCADDDFILSDTLSLGYDLISNNKKITTIIGNIIQFHEKFDNTFFSNKLYESINFNYEPRKNVEYFLSDYRQILWGMYKKEILTISFRIINELQLKNDNFIELIISVISSYNGEIKFLNNIWSARELSLNEHWATRHQSLFYYKTNKLIQNDIKKFELIIDKNTKYGIGNIAVTSYLKSKNLKTFKFLIKGIIKNYLRLNLSKILPKNSVTNYTNYIYENNHDLKKIANLLIK